MSSTRTSIFSNWAPARHLSVPSSPAEAQRLANGGPMQPVVRQPSYADVQNQTFPTQASNSRNAVVHACHAGRPNRTQASRVRHTIAHPYHAGRPNRTQASRGPNTIVHPPIADRGIPTQASSVQDTIARDQTLLTVLEGMRTLDTDITYVAESAVGPKQDIAVCAAIPQQGVTYLPWAPQTMYKSRTCHARKEKGEWDPSYNRAAFVDLDAQLQDAGKVISTQGAWGYLEPNPKMMLRAVLMALMRAPQEYRAERKLGPLKVTILVPITSPVSSLLTLHLDELQKSDWRWHGGAAENHQSVPIPFHEEFYQIWDACHRVEDVHRGSSVTFDRASDEACAPARLLCMRELEKCGALLSQGNPPESWSKGPQDTALDKLVDVMTPVPKHDAQFFEHDAQFLEQGYGVNWNVSDEHL